MSIIVIKFLDVSVLVNFCNSNAIQLGFIHMAVSVSFASHMVFYLRLVFMLFQQFIDKSLIPAVLSYTFAPDYKNILNRSLIFVGLFHRNSALLTL